MPGGATAFSGQVHDAIGIGERPDLLTPTRRRQYDIGELGGLGQEQVLHNKKQIGLAEDVTDPWQLRQ